MQCIVLGQNLDVKENCFFYKLHEKETWEDLYIHCTELHPS